MLLRLVSARAVCDVEKGEGTMWQVEARPGPSVKKLGSWRRRQVGTNDILSGE